MTQNETIWLLVGFIQFGIMGFVSYWTRRVQRMEDNLAKLQETIAETMEERTNLLIQYQGRVSKLEAQFEQIMVLLIRIEKRMDRRDDED